MKIVTGPTIAVAMSLALLSVGAKSQQETPVREDAAGGAWQRIEPRGNDLCSSGPHVVTATMLNVRNSPLLGDVTAQIPEGTQVVVSSCSGLWAEIGPRLWVHAHYLSALRDEQSAQERFPQRR